MLKRTLYFGSPYYLQTRLNQLVFVNKETEQETSCPIEDLGFIIFDNPQITCTTGCIEALVRENVAVVYCDKRHMPNAMLLNFSGNSTHNESVRSQLYSSEPLRKQLWKQTVQAKLLNQSRLLKKLSRNYSYIDACRKNVLSGDTSNKEAMAAKYYWKTLFNNTNFTRGREGPPPNFMLNYGYAIVRAAVARALVGSGLMPVLGIYHHNKYNPFCLADDIMEPFRPFVDETVEQLYRDNPDTEELTKDMKVALLNVLTVDTQYSKVKRPLMVGLSQTTASLARCFAGVQRTIEYPTLP